MLLLLLSLYSIIGVCEQAASTPFPCPLFHLELFSHPRMCVFESWICVLTQYKCDCDSTFHEIDSLECFVTKSTSLIWVAMHMLPEIFLSVDSNACFGVKCCGKPYCLEPYYSWTCLLNTFFQDFNWFILNCQWIKEKTGNPTTSVILNIVTFASGVYCQRRSNLINAWWKTVHNS